MSLEFMCNVCGATTPALAPAGFRCGCGAPWSLPPGPALDTRRITDAASGVWRFRAQIRLPDNALAAPLTLGEGCGRWLRPAQGPRIALAHLEPTLSFKDRGVAVLMAWAKLAAKPPLIEDSSGNAGGSFAAYAVAAGLACRVYVPASAPPAKVAALHAFGAEVIAVDGPRANATEAALSDREGTYCSHGWNPMFLDGTKTLALQWWQEHGGVLPRRVYVPAGQGSLVIGLQYGFDEIRRGIPEFRAPEIVAVQHRTAAPLWTATGEDGVPPAVTPDDEPSIADGIAIDAPVRREDLARAIRDSGGRVRVVGNEEIRVAQARLAAMGVWAEPTGAVAMAGWLQTGADDDALVVVTGHGLKAAW
ncbi:MAG: pyridoxal-phosphate dependent enzyme [Acidobacteriota bacterium]